MTKNKKEWEEEIEKFYFVKYKGVDEFIIDVKSFIKENFIHKEELLKKLKDIEKRWDRCDDKNCDNRDNCEFINYFIDTIWKPTFKDIINLIKKE